MFDLSTLKTGPLRRVRTRNGDFLTLASDSAGIGALLAYYGEYANHEVALLKALTKAGDTVIDVGANIGTHTIPLAKHVSPTGRLIAFEAQPVIAMLLQANLALNDTPWVEVRLAAAGAVPGRLSVPMVDYTHPGQNFGGVSLVGAQSEGAVPVERLDDLGASPAVMKIDVEGMELEVLKGGAATITAFQPALYIENYPGPRNDQVLLWLQDQGYRLFWDVYSIHAADNFHGQTQPFFWNGLASNVLALPRGRAFDVEAFGLEVVRDIHDHKFTRALAAMEALRVQA
jgi:FkbM family methyltransferase